MRLLLLFAHPALDKSRVHRAMLDVARAIPDVTVHNLYEHYPDFDIDVAREQALCLEHDVIVFQHPLYWYSTPALIKQWEDLVLTHGWAYGTGGTALAGKLLFCAVSTGAGRQAYGLEGLNKRTVRDFLAPIEQTAWLCGMRYLPPFLVHGTHLLDEGSIDVEAERYAAALKKVVTGEVDVAAHLSADELVI